MFEVGDKYRHEDHLGEITHVEKFLDKDGEWRVGMVVHLPTMPEGQQWLMTAGPIEDYVKEYPF